MKLSAARCFLVIISLLVTTPLSSAQVVDRNHTLAVMPMDGVFYNILAQAGGSVSTSLDIQTSNVSGPMNFTQRPEDLLILCGAGNFSGARSNSIVIGSFISHDSDPGCNFDDGAIVTITGTLGLESKLFYGEYSTKNANGSNFDESKSRGVFEAWTVANQPSIMRYEGRFTNTTVNRGGKMTIDIAVGQQIIYGYENATNDPGQSPLCGADFFTGYRKPSDTIEFSFVSNDQDTGCGSDHGVRNIFQAAFSNNHKILTGTYVVGNSGATFTLSLIQTVYLPLLKK